MFVVFLEITAPSDAGGGAGGCMIIRGQREYGSPTPHIPYPIGIFHMWKSESLLLSDPYCVLHIFFKAIVDAVGSQKHQLPCKSRRE